MTARRREQPDAHRLALLRSVFHPTTLDNVADAIAVATQYARRIYIERVSGGYRWSPTHSGGSYPLLRITARFLDVDHHRFAIAFRTVSDGICILCQDPEHPSPAEQWAVIDFDEPVEAPVVRQRIAQALAYPARL